MYKRLEINQVAYALTEGASDFFHIGEGDVLLCPLNFRACV